MFSCLIPTKAQKPCNVQPRSIQYLLTSLFYKYIPNKITRVMNASGQDDQQSLPEVFPNCLSGHIKEESFRYQ